MIEINIDKHCIQKGERGYIFIPSPELINQMDILIKTINNNSILPIALLVPFDATQIPTNGKFVRNYMSRDYYYDNFEIKFAGYPTDENNFYLTNIEFETNQYNLLGITIGDKQNNVVEALHSFGFSKMPEKCSQSYLCFGNLDVRIGVHFKDNVVVRMVISVATYYLGNRLY